MGKVKAPAQWANRIVGMEMVPPDQLVANPNNWRVHGGAQRDALRAALNTVGWVQNVIANRTTGNLVDGHARVEEALSRGEATVPVVYVELTPAEEALVLATLDPLSAMAGRDAAKLDELLAEVATNDPDLLAMLEGLVGPKVADGLTDPDDVPAVPDEPYVQRGDVWLLGDHRVMCGDSTDAGDVGRLMGALRPSLMVTDPPYGVGYEPEWRNDAFGEANRAVGTVRNDDQVDWREAWSLFSGDVAYIWHAGVHAAEVASGIAASGFEIRAQIIWAKQHFAISRGHYHVQHEPCWYAVRRGRTASWSGGRKQSTVWEVDNGLAQGGPKAPEDAPTGHGTQKPVEVMRRAIRNHSGDVYDPFLGSGTAIIAAEQLGRRCYAMEIDPRYAQVAIERWQAFTGRQAVKDGSHLQAVA